MEKFEDIGKFENKEKEQFQDLIIFTTTLYGNDEVSKMRSELAEEFFDNTNKLGIKCVVVDGGSDYEFLEKISKFDNIKLVIEPSLKMGESRRKSLQEALNMVPNEVKKPIFLWIEPEKSGLITRENLSEMIKKLRKNEADIVVPARKNKNSLPEFQGRIESEANKKVKEEILLFSQKTIGENELDLWFGPKMFNVDGAQYFLDYKGKLDKWDSIIGPVIDAYNDGKKIVSIPIDFEYNKKQRNQEDDEKSFDKRVEQYTEILAAFGHKPTSFWIERKKYDKK